MSVPKNSRFFMLVALSYWNISLKEFGRRPFLLLAHIALQKLINSKGKQDFIYMIYCSGYSNFVTSMGVFTGVAWTDRWQDREGAGWHAGRSAARDRQKRPEKFDRTIEIYSDHMMSSDQDMTRSLHLPVLSCFNVSALRIKKAPHDSMKY